jgi:hypothetical protein
LVGGIGVGRGVGPGGEVLGGVGAGRVLGVDVGVGSADAG